MTGPGGTSWIGCRGRRHRRAVRSPRPRHSIISLPTRVHQCDMLGETIGSAVTYEGTVRARRTPASPTVFAVMQPSGHLPNARQRVGNLLEEGGPPSSQPGQPTAVEVPAVDQVREPMLVFGHTEFAEPGVDGVDG